MDNLTNEQTYINTKKAIFAELFNKNADDNLELFLAYLSEHTNRQLKFELENFNEKLRMLEESGFFDSDN